MIDKFVEKLLQSVTSAYMPKFRDIAQTRSNELADMKAKYGHGQKMSKHGLTKK
jgi:hypothetical protein